MMILGNPIVYVLKGDYKLMLGPREELHFVGMNCKNLRAYPPLNPNPKLPCRGKP